ncbi:MAG: Flp pilus assembly protein CpaB [Planctomycetes bacterium]|nr:Flp pilus assembly protein CpaB [Planctomycetota bacterium]
MQTSRLLLIGIAMAVIAALATGLLQSVLGDETVPGENTANAAANVNKPPVRAPSPAVRADGATLGSELPAGTRAITITLRDNGPEVMLYPGARVDVLATMDAPGMVNGRRETLTRTVLEGARVVAVNEDTVLAASASDERRGSHRTTVTLAVTPQHAAQIELAAARGTLGLSLRSEKDGDTPSSVPAEASTRALFAFEEPAPKVPEAAPVPVAPAPVAPAPAPPKWEVLVIRGESSERHEFVEQR